jgi:hypothetical protein
MLKLNKEQTLGFINRRILKRGEDGKIDTNFLSSILTGSLEQRETLSQLILHAFVTLKETTGQ